MLLFFSQQATVTGPSRKEIKQQTISTMKNLKSKLSEGTDFTSFIWCNGLFITIFFLIHVNRILNTPVLVMGHYAMCPGCFHIQCICSLWTLASMAYCLCIQAFPVLTIRVLSPTLMCENKCPAVTYGYNPVFTKCCRAILQYALGVLDPSQASVGCSSTMRNWTSL